MYEKEKLIKNSVFYKIMVTTFISHLIVLLAMITVKILLYW